MIDFSALETLFFSALEKPTAERATFLDHACQDNPDLRAHIDRLLNAHPRAGTFLEPSHTHSYIQPPTELHPTIPDTTLNLTPKPDVGNILAGKYKLLEMIGVGGMGSVWMAQQFEPIKRLVAVKVIKAGIDSKDVLARFDAERQALALMDHPNISRVFDAGSTPDGRPFFVMELVKGAPITQFCDQYRLTPRERLELFVPVCQAIQHAHQKGVIHRDIKPRNVLVTLYDDRPVPKVIDFGVAKATSQPLTEQTLNTAFGAIVGTPEYMSPEQATFDNLDIDTRSDVYALGVLLYELLTGSSPVSRMQLEKVGLLEILRVIREDEPPRPSTRLSSTDTLPSLAANRGMEPRKLTGLLRNELDWIVMKALEKDRRRRYESANGMAMDVLRYLSGEPVQAVPPSAGYRVRKFVRKHRGPVFGVLAVLLVLVLGMVGTTWGLLSAEQARTAVAEQQLITEAKEAARAREEAARARAEAEVGRQQQAEEQRQLRNRQAVTDSLSQLKKALGEGNAQHAQEAFEQAQRRIAEGGADDLKEKLDRYSNELDMLSELDRIDDDCWIAVDGKLPSHAAIFSRWAKVFDDYGIALDTLSSQEVAQRIKDSPIKERLLTSLEIWFVVSRKPALRDILAAADPDDFRNESRTTSYQQAVRSLALLDEPVPPHQPASFAIGHGGDLTIDRNTREELMLGALRDKPNSYALFMMLANLDMSNNKESSLRRAGWYRAALVVQPNSMVAWNNLGNALCNTSDLPTAIAACKEAIRLDSKYAPPYGNLGTALAASGDLVGAIDAYKEALRRNPNDAGAHNNLGNARKDSGDLAGAIATYKEGIRLNPRYAMLRYNLGVALAAVNDQAGAIAAYKEAILLDPKSATTRNNLGIALAAIGDVSAAIVAFRGAISLDPKFASAYSNLGIALANSGDVPGAIASLRKAIQLDPGNVSAHYNLGNALNISGNKSAAIASYKETIRLDPKYALAHYNLGNILKASGDLPGAIAAFREAARLDPKHALTQFDLGATYMQQKKFPDAIACAREAIRIDPKFSTAHAMLGDALRQTGDIRGARVALTEATRLDPKRWGPLLAKLPPVPVAPPPREAKP